MLNDEQIRARLAEITPEAVTSAYRAAESTVRERLDDAAWWAAAAPLVAEALDPLLDDDDHQRHRFDPLLADLILGLIVRLSADGSPGAERVALRARLWVGRWVAETRDREPSPPKWPAGAVATLLAPPTAALAALRGAEVDEWVSGARMCLRAILGDAFLPIEGQWTPTPIEPWVAVPLPVRVEPEPVLAVVTPIRRDERPPTPPEQPRPLTQAEAIAAALSGTGVFV